MAPAPQPRRDPQRFQRAFVSWRVRKGARGGGMGPRSSRGDRSDRREMEVPRVALVPRCTQWRKTTTRSVCGPFVQQHVRLLPVASLASRQQVRRCVWPLLREWDDVVRVELTSLVVTAVRAAVVELASDAHEVRPAPMSVAASLTDLASLPVGSHLASVGAVDPSPTVGGVEPLAARVALKLTNWRDLQLDRGRAMSPWLCVLSRADATRAPLDLAARGNTAKDAAAEAATGALLVVGRHVLLSADLARTRATRCVHLFSRNDETPSRETRGSYFRGSAGSVLRCGQSRIRMTFCLARPAFAPARWLQRRRHQGHGDPCANPRYVDRSSLWSRCRPGPIGPSGWPQRVHGSDA